MKINDLDREIIKFIQGDIPVESRPFLSLSQNINLSEAEIVNSIKKLQKDGIVKRFAAIIGHYQAGYKVNAMVAWKVEAEDADRVGSIMATYDQVSHCYMREVPKEFGYCLFSMIHASNENDLNKIVENIAINTNIKEYVIIKSIQELKKISMKYEF
ncbi:MAG: Lrp/AsnC family transcriptional regulator [Syntrophomonadaceae bacterium]|jgi:DNA-binding Lrp family transcriptional regulator